MIPHDNKLVEFRQITKYITLMYFVHKLAHLFHLWVVSHNLWPFARKSEATKEWVQGVGARSESGSSLFVKWSEIKFYKDATRQVIEFIWKFLPSAPHTHTQSVNDIVLREFSPLLDVSIAQPIFSSGVIRGPVSFPEVWILSISSI